MIPRDKLESALCDFEHPFTHWEALSVSASPDKHLRMGCALYWLGTEDLIRQMWNNDGHWDYILIKQLFYDLCAAEHMPYCNAVGFWYETVKCSEGDPGLSATIVNRLLMCALGSYGDIFNYATMRLLPRDFVFPTEIDNPTYSKNQKQIIDRINQTSKSYNLSVSNFWSFKKVWDNHCLKKQKYNNWASKLDSVNYCDKTSEVNIDAITPLANIFHQYINLLNEYSNSPHRDFNRTWESWLKDKDSSSMSGVFQCISDNIEKEPELARIAPEYVTTIFQKYIKKIYSPSSDRKREASYAKLKSIVLSDTLFEELEGSNKKIPRKSLVITYCILRKYYEHELVDRVDLALSDYIFEINCSMIGLKKYFTEDVYQQITTEGKVFPSKTFKESDEWVHPLLQQCATRLKVALELYPSSAPQVFDGCEPSAQTKCKVNDLFPKKKSNFFTDKIIDQYQDILLNGQSALGSHNVSPERRWSLAELFDKILIKLPKVYELTQKEDNFEILAAVSQVIHEECMWRVSKRIYLHTLSFLYQWFYSDKFQCDYTFGKLIKDELKKCGYNDAAINVSCHNIEHMDQASADRYKENHPE